VFPRKLDIKRLRSRGAQAAPLLGSRVFVVVEHTAPDKVLTEICVEAVGCLHRQSHGDCGIGASTSSFAAMPFAQRLQPLEFLHW